MRRRNERFTNDAAGSQKASSARPVAVFLQRRRYAVLPGLRGEDSIAELCGQEGIARSPYYSWSKEFMEAGKKRLAG